MELDYRIRAYRVVAYAAVTFSVIAVLSICISLPMVYSYVHHVRRNMRGELNDCTVGFQRFRSLSKATMSFHKTR